MQRRLSLYFLPRFPEQLKTKLLRDPLQQLKPGARQFSKSGTEYKQENLNKNASTRVPEETANQSRKGIWDMKQTLKRPD